MATQSRDPFTLSLSARSRIGSSCLPELTWAGFCASPPSLTSDDPEARRSRSDSDPFYRGSLRSASSSSSVASVGLGPASPSHWVQSNLKAAAEFQPPRLLRG